MAECPFLGLAQDRSARFAFPSPGHRCFSDRRPVEVNLTFQARYCLTDAHPACERFIAAVPARRERLPRPEIRQAADTDNAASELALSRRSELVPAPLIKRAPLVVMDAARARDGTRSEPIAGTPENRHVGVPPAAAPDLAAVGDAPIGPAQPAGTATGDAARRPWIRVERVPAFVDGQHVPSTPPPPEAGASGAPTNRPSMASDGHGQQIAPMPTPTTGGSETVSRPPEAVPVPTAGDPGPPGRPDVWNDAVADDWASTPAAEGRRPSFRSQFVLYRVRVGDTLAGIAEASGTTIDAILSANDLEPPVRLFVGQRLRIPIRR